MYDAMLDDLEDDVTTAAEESLDLGVKTVGRLNIEDDVDEDVDLEEEKEEEEAAADDDSLPAVSEDSESWSDDPVRMYLTQMGEIPLLTRQEEIALAKQIEVTRARFRRKLLECDYVMQKAQADQARATLDLAEKTYTRLNQLKDEDLISQQQIDEAQANMLQAEAGLKIAEASPCGTSL